MTSAGSPFNRRKAKRHSIHILRSGWSAAGSLAPKTRDTYGDVYRLHISPTFGAKGLIKINSGDVANWFVAKKASTPLQAAKAYRMLRTVLTAVMEAPRKRSSLVVVFQPSDQRSTE
jgi:hypothetical protein